MNTAAALFVFIFFAGFSYYFSSGFYFLCRKKYNAENSMAF
ncbi:MAG: hypothetical protein ACI4J6_09445 [Oscillospiraceae bacterium]